MKRLRLFLLLGVLYPQIVKAQAGYDTLKVFFRLNEYQLEDSSVQSFLKSWEQLPNAVERKLLIYGYADYLGTEAANYTLADRRVAKVKGLLLEKGVSKENILVEAGIGALPYEGPRNAAGRQEDRRVDVFLRRVETREHITVGVPKKIADLKPKESIEVKDLLFISGMHRLIPSSIPVLKKLSEELNQSKNKKFIVEGHICCQFHIEDGTDVETGIDNLSEARAQFIVGYLIKNGFPAENLKFIGYGSSRPKVYPEKNDQDQQLNRRVEIRLVE